MKITKKKLLIIVLSTIILMLSNSAVSYGSSFSLAGDFYNGYNSLKLESFACNRLVPYVELFMYDRYDLTYKTMILGAEYFLIKVGDYNGFYIGAGLPLFRDFTVDEDPYHDYLLGPAYKSGMELRSGIRFTFSEDCPFLDFGYSNIKMWNVNVGFNF